MVYADHIENICDVILYWHVVWGSIHNKLFALTKESDPRRIRTFQWHKIQVLNVKQIYGIGKEFATDKGA